MWPQFEAPYYRSIDKLERIQRQARGKKKKAIRGVKLPSEGGWGLRKSQGWRHFREEQVVAHGARMNIWAAIGTWQRAPQCLRPRAVENR